MRNRRTTRHPNGFPALTALALVVSVTACGTDGTPDDTGGREPVELSRVPGEPMRDDPPVERAPEPDDVAEPGTVPPTDPSDTTLTLEARLRTWSERQVVVDYTLRNDGDTGLVVLDASPSLQIERLEDGRVRLFRGKQDTGDTDFGEAPTIEGRALAPGESVRGSGSRAVPLTLDFAFDRAVDPGTDAVEFCIGHGPASELVPTRRDDGSYSLNEDLELQRLVCTTLERDSAPGTGGASPLDDEKWERTLGRVLETIDGEARDVVLEAALAPRLPDTSSDAVDGVEVLGEPDTFVLADGTPGTRARASCGGGGGFELVRTSGDADVVSVEATACVLGARRIDGRVVRTGASGAGVDERAAVTLDDFVVDDGTRRVRVFAGVHESGAESHLARTSAWRGASYRLEEGSEVRTVTGLEFEDVAIFGTAFDRRLSASFTVSASWTNDRPLAVTTPRAFAGLTTSETGDFTRGALVLETADGERLTLDADSGQPGSVLITLERGAAVTSVFRPWPAALRR